MQICSYSCLLLLAFFIVLFCYFVVIIMFCSFVTSCVHLFVDCLSSFLICGSVCSYSLFLRFAFICFVRDSRYVYIDMFVVLLFVLVCFKLCLLFYMFLLLFLMRKQICRYKYDDIVFVFVRFLSIFVVYVHVLRTCYTYNLCVTYMYTYMYMYMYTYMYLYMFSMCFLIVKKSQNRHAKQTKSLNNHKAK